PADDLHCAEEKTYLLGRGFGRIRAVYGIGLDIFRKILADRAWCGLCGVRCPHDFSIPGDRIVAFKHLNDHRARRHESDETAEERPLTVDRVESLGLRTRKQQTFLRHDSQARLFEP